MKRLLALAIPLLAACGGGGSTPAEPMVVSSARVGDSFVYADGAWKYSDPRGKWVVRGTSETEQFGLMPVWWYLPAGQENGRDWWTLTNTPRGLVSRASPSEDAYNASMVNDVFTANVSDRPVIYVEYSILKFIGDRARVAVGVSLRFPDDSQFYLEQNLRRTDSFDLCPGLFDRCAENSYYFPPSAQPGVIDVRTLLLQIMPASKADTMRVAGVYIGSECYGHCEVDVEIEKYRATTEK